MLSIVFCPSQDCPSHQRFALRSRGQLDFGGLLTQSTNFVGEEDGGSSSKILGDGQLFRPHPNSSSLRGWGRYATIHVHTQTLVYNALQIDCRSRPCCNTTTWRCTHGADSVAVYPWHILGTIHEQTNIMGQKTNFIVHAVTTTSCATVHRALSNKRHERNQCEWVTGIRFENTQSRAWEMPPETSHSIWNFNSYMSKDVVANQSPIYDLKPMSEKL